MSNNDRTCNYHYQLMKLSNNKMIIAKKKKKKKGKKNHYSFFVGNKQISNKLIFFLIWIAISVVRNDLTVKGGGYPTS